MSLIDRLFLLREIRSRDGELHFRRWGVECRLFGIYLHAIYLPDFDFHLHSHPWSFISKILVGSYEEVLRLETSTPKYRSHRFRSSDVLMRTAEQYHKILAVFDPPVYTLVVRGPRRRPDWGYEVSDHHMPNADYRAAKPRPV